MTSSSNDSFTRREAEICMLLCKGLPVKEIAFQIGVSYHTADYHKRNVYRKSGVASRAELYAHFSTAHEIEVRAVNRDSDLAHILRKLEAIEKRLELSFSAPVSEQSAAQRTLTR